MAPSRPFFHPPSSFLSRSPRPSRPRSVISIPVSDCPPPRPPAPRRPSPPPRLSPSLAAAKIQSRFRGFSVRLHKPLAHLRAIASVVLELDHLQAEMQRPDFRSTVRESAKERMRFSESIMALLLKLDAVDGAIPEVRSRRKEATRKAIRLQDVLDALLQEAEPQQDALDAVLQEAGQENAESSATGSPNVTSSDTVGLTKETEPQEDDKSSATHSPIFVSSDTVGLTKEASNGFFSDIDDFASQVINEGHANPRASLAYNNDLESSAVGTGSADQVTAGTTSCPQNITEEGNVDNHRNMAREVASAETNGCPLRQTAALGTTFSEQMRVDLNARPDDRDETLEGATRLLKGEDEPDLVEARSNGISGANGLVSEDVTASGADGLVSENLKPRVQEETPQPSDRQLLEQLSEDSKHLKMLLTKLYVQNQLQNKAIVALNKRLGRLEQQATSGKQTHSKHLSRRKLSREGTLLALTKNCSPLEHTLIERTE